MTTRSPSRRSRFCLDSRRPYSVLRGDCRQLLPQVPPASVQLAFADPPYHLSNGGFTCHAGKRVPVHKGSWDVSGGVEADHAFHLEWLGALRQCLSPTGSLFVSGTHHVIYSIGFALQELGFSIVNIITWYKPNAAPNLACRTFAHSTELIIWAAPSTAREPLLRSHQARLPHLEQFDFEVPAPFGKQVIWPITTPAPREKQFGRHPTQKPLTLLQRLIHLASAPGELVMDPFAGSGTTGVAAVQLGRRFIGFETDPAYIKLSKSRLQSPPPMPEPAGFPALESVA